MKVSTDELRKSALLLLQHIEASGQTEFEIAEDFYWDIPSEQKYKPYEKPTELTMGQLSDDWIEVTRMTGGTRVPVAYGLVWLSAVLRRVGGERSRVKRSIDLDDGK